MAHVCMPKEDGISSMTNLLQHNVHRVCIWVIITITIGGNLMVIICRYLWQEESSIHALFITHLCSKYCLVEQASIARILAHVHAVMHLRHARTNTHTHEDLPNISTHFNALEVRLSTHSFAKASPCLNPA